MRIKSKLTEDEFEELVRPKLKLFLSVDVVGSTSFKQNSSGVFEQSWLNLFISFFTEFPDLLNSALAKQEERRNQGKLPPLRPWKSLGDELIFTVELSKRDQAALIIKAFAAALRKAAENWHSDANPARQELHVKGTAWLAGFPVGNAEIPLEVTRDENSDGRDYIGPQIDTGFRLKEFASPRKLVISADLAYLILSAGVPDLLFFFEGHPTLKGVLRGKPYPLIWLDCEAHDECPAAAFNRLKDDLAQRKPAGHDTLKRYLKLWLEQSPSLMGAPFIHKDIFEDLRPAEGYDEMVQHVRSDLQGLFYVQQDEPQSETVPEKKVSAETEQWLSSLANATDAKPKGVRPARSSKSRRKPRGKKPGAHPQ